MRSVLEGLERGETITITHQGKKKGVITPIRAQVKKSVVEHEFFGMHEKDYKNGSVETHMKKLRKPRYAL